MYTLVKGLRNLSMDKIQRFDYWFGSEDPDSHDLEQAELARIGTIGDGSCFFHAFLRSVSQRYTDMNTTQRKAYARKLRRELAALMTPERYASLHFGTEEDIAAYSVDPEHAHIASPATLSRYLASCKWVGEEVTEFLSDEFGVDIIVLYYTRKRFGKSLTRYLYEDLPNGKKHDKTVIVLNIEDAHFESVGLIKGDELFTLFDSDDPLIVSLKLAPIPKLPPQD